MMLSQLKAFGFKVVAIFAAISAIFAAILFANRSGKVQGKAEATATAKVEAAAQEQTRAVETTSNIQTTAEKAKQIQTKVDSSADSAIDSELLDNWTRK